MRLDWSTVSLTEIVSNRILVAATGFMENSEMKFERYDHNDDKNPDRMMVHNNWGKAPILCEDILLTLSLLTNGKTIQCFALDLSGCRKFSLNYNVIGGNVVIPFNSDSKTRWNE
ncbi:MAG: hypothetical protein LBI18_08705 [Planctomycetaceae bacterium]|jgi:hypothetical protein|nr:hypothetical protein [Planctomycetaceae bacterium]